AVQDRDLGALDLDEAVVQADTGGRGENVFDGPDQDPVVLEGGCVVEGGGRFEASGDWPLGVVHPEENQTVIDGGRSEMGFGRMTRVQADALDGDRGPQCRLLSHAIYTQSIRSQ